MAPADLKTQHHHGLPQRGNCVPVVSFSYARARPHTDWKISRLLTMRQKVVACIILDLSDWMPSITLGEPNTSIFPSKMTSDSYVPSWQYQVLLVYLVYLK